MTDALTPDAAAQRAVSAHTRRRYAAEGRFKLMGLASVGVALFAVVALVGSILLQSLPALTEHRLTATLRLDPAFVDPGGRRDPDDIRLNGDFYGLVQEHLARQFPGAEAAGQADALFSLINPITVAPLGRAIADDPALVGTERRVSFALQSDLDLYLKGAITKERIIEGRAPATLTPQADGTWTIVTERALVDALAGLKRRLSTEAARLEQEAALRRNALPAAEARNAAAQAALDAAPSESARDARRIEADAAEGDVLTLRVEIEDFTRLAADYRARAAATAAPESLSTATPSFLLEAGGGLFKLTRLDASTASAAVIAPPTRQGQIPAGGWRVRELVTPEAERPVGDAAIAFTRALADRGAITLAPNGTIFASSDSNQPELAGLAGAIVGSILTLVVTMLLAAPLGVLTAIYLEEFAPKNRWTDLIEVNINNLAAVPSIVFGLLGLAVFLNFFGMPRSAPIVGGVVLTLMSLPIIIIASRAALKAVPPSIREAALGVGASKTQAVFGHVLPLAAPGILTGTILAMAHALGETAPLLMIGMVAFVADVPQGFTDSATVLPVEIYMWASRPERAWEPRTALSIIILLAFMIAMNALAVYLRRRFERRW